MANKKVNKAVREYMSKLGKKGGKRSWEVRSKQITKRAAQKKVEKYPPAVIGGAGLEKYD